MSQDLFNALYGAGENLEKAVLFATENGLQIPGLAEAAFDLSQALCLLCPRPVDKNRRLRIS